MVDEIRQRWAGAKLGGPGTVVIPGYEGDLREDVAFLLSMLPGSPARPKKKRSASIKKGTKVDT